MPTPQKSPSKPIYFGPPPGVKEGQHFKGHDELYAANVHRFRGRGISGTAREGVDSIVASGGYAGDRDLGDVVIYTGQGGAPDKEGHITDDQELTGANAGLVVNCQEGLPVRFVRGLNIVRGKAKGGYRYRGLYLVDSYWNVRTERGYIMWQFKLCKALDGDAVVESDVSEPVEEGEELDSGMTKLERVTAKLVTAQRRVRNTRESRVVKSIYDDTCQMCRMQIIIDSLGTRYSEGAHIQALGEPHCGPDISENILCLCPNCHVLFDNGVRFITDDLAIVDGLTGEMVGKLLVEASRHKIDKRFLRQHRSRWADRTTGL